MVSYVSYPDLSGRAKAATLSPDRSLTGTQPDRPQPDRPQPDRPQPAAPRPTAPGRFRRDHTCSRTLCNAAGWSLETPAAARRRAAAAVAGLLVWPGAAAAQAPLYTVEKVEVDATAGSATAARKTGLAQAHVRAFNRLVERLVLRSELDRVPELDADRIATLLRDFEVFNERTSDVRYLAEVTFRFQPESIRQFLRDNDIPFAVTRSKPVVVLPVWGEGEDAVLWGNPNPWREAWADRAEQTGLVPLTVPLGDLGDITAVSAQNALDSDRDALKTLAERYGAADVLVTQARLAGDPEAFTASMQVITSRIGTPDMERTLVDSVQQQREEPLERMLARAADRVARDVEETWKRANLLNFDQRNRLRVEVPLDGLARWVTCANASIGSRGSRTMPSPR